MGRDGSPDSWGPRGRASGGLESWVRRRRGWGSRLLGLREEGLGARTPASPTLSFLAAPEETPPCLAAPERLRGVTMTTPLVILLLTFALGSAAQEGGDQPGSWGGGCPHPQPPIFSPVDPPQGLLSPGCACSGPPLAPAASSFGRQDSSAFCLLPSCFLLPPGVSVSPKPCLRTQRLSHQLWGWPPRQDAPPGFLSGLPLSLSVSISCSFCTFLLFCLSPCLSVCLHLSPNPSAADSVLLDSGEGF